MNTGRNVSGDAPSFPVVSVVIPAHNEEKVIAESLRAIMEHIPPWNVHVVSDGSTDDTVRIARKAAGMELHQSSEARTIVRSLVDLAHNLVRPQVEHRPDEAAVGAVRDRVGAFQRRIGVVVEGHFRHQRTRRASESFTPRFS